MKPDLGYFVYIAQKDFNTLCKPGGEDIASFHLLCVCLYTCMPMCVHSCMHVCVCVCVCVWARALSDCLCGCKCICVCVCVSVRTIFHSLTSLMKTQDVKQIYLPATFCVTGISCCWRLAS